MYYTNVVSHYNYKLSCNLEFRSMLRFKDQLFCVIGTIIHDFVAQQNALSFPSFLSKATFLSLFFSGGLGELRLNPYSRIESVLCDWAPSAADCH